jgi:hypothetical protein
MTEEDIREFTESPLKQGADESIVRTILTTPWGSSPTDVEVAAYDVTKGGYKDVSEDCLSGSASVDGDLITLPALEALQVGHVYRLEVKFTCGSNVFEAWGLFEGER